MKRNARQSNIISVTKVNNVYDLIVRWSITIIKITNGVVERNTKKLISWLFS